MCCHLRVAFEKRVTMGLQCSLERGRRQETGGWNTVFVNYLVNVASGDECHRTSPGARKYSENETKQNFHMIFSRRNPVQLWFWTVRKEVGSGWCNREEGCACVCLVRSIQKNIWRCQPTVYRLSHKLQFLTPTRGTPNYCFPFTNICCMSCSSHHFLFYYTNITFWRIPHIKL